MRQRAAGPPVSDRLSWPAMSLLPARGRTWIPLVLLLIVWAVALVITHPIGNFPIDDDWCFAQSAQTLASHGDLRLPWCAEATLVTHVAWGGLFVSLSHFSFNVLRLSTYAIAALGMIAVWQLVVEVGGSAGTATLATAAFAFNPVVFLLTNTFMTDVPFAAWSAVSALCLVRALKRPTTWAICLAAATSVTATLLRQPGILLPLMFVPRIRHRARTIAAVSSDRRHSHPRRAGRICWLSDLD